MLPPYCCWLVGVCGEPGKDGPPNVPGGVAGAGPACEGGARSPAAVVESPTL